MTEDLTDEQADDLVALSRSERINRLFGFDPFGWQRDALDDESPDKSINCGRQVGKSEIGGAVAADFVFSGRGDVMVAARFQDTADDMFGRMTEHFDRMGYSDAELGIETRNNREWEFANGYRVFARPLPHDAPQVRGKLPKCIIIDEASLVKDEVFDRVVRPMFVTHGFNHELWEMSTPRGKSGYHYRKHTKDPDFTSFTVKTPEFVRAASDAGRTDIIDESAADWITREREKVDSLTWRQEYEAIFVELGDVYLPSSLVEPCVTSNESGDVARSESAQAWLGVDPARSGEDRSVYTSVDESGHVFDVRSKDTETVPESVGRIKALHREHNYTGILIDENAIGGGVVDFSSEALPNVRPVTFSSKSKQAMYQTLKKCFESGALTLPANDRLIHETTSLEYDFTANGILRVEHPPGGHDDHPDSLALAVYGWQQAQQRGPRRRSRRGAMPSQKSRVRSR